MARGRLNLAMSDYGSSFARGWNSRSGQVMTDGIYARLPATPFSFIVCSTFEEGGGRSHYLSPS